MPKGEEMSSAIPEYHPSSVFSPQRVFLVTDANTFRIVTLWISYDFDRQQVMFDIYSAEPFQRKYFDSFPAAKQALLALDAQYPGMIEPEPLLSLWKAFFAIEGMVGHTADVQHVSHWCARCDNFTTNSFSFLYCPSVPGTSLSEASLSLKWESGCGMKSIVGKFKDVSDEVRTTLSEMISQAEESCKDDLQNALSLVKARQACSF